MTDTDRLAALLHKKFAGMRTGPCWHPEFGEFPNECEDVAARLIAAGVTLAPTPDPLLAHTITPECNVGCDPDAGWHYLVGEAMPRRRSGLLAAGLLLAAALLALVVWIVR